MPVPCETKTIFHFASHTHPAFELSPQFERDTVMDSFRRCLEFCERRGALFVYPSSALVYERETPFSRFKKTLEGFVSNYDVRSLGLRIFPVYGPGEDRTVISRWCREMGQGLRPIVYGDGTQTRDFIYIDDVVQQILTLVDETRWNSRIADIGTGIATSFNTIVDLINRELGTDIKPQYVERPSSYSEGIVCKEPRPFMTSIVQGIKRLVCETE